MSTPQPITPRPLPPLFRHVSPSERRCGLCRRLMVRLTALVGEWFACTRCDAP
jgi:hypothetical protein